MFTVRTRVYASMDFVIMENVASRFYPSNLKMTFDLKGSSYNRETKVKSQFWNKSLNCPGVLKELNFLQISRDLGNKLMNINERVCEKTLKILERDT